MFAYVDGSTAFRNAQVEAWKLGVRFAWASPEVWQAHGLPRFDALCIEWRDQRDAIRRALHAGYVHAGAWPVRGGAA